MDPDHLITGQGQTNMTENIIFSRTTYVVGNNDDHNVDDNDGLLFIEESMSQKTRIRHDLCMQYSNSKFLITVPHSHHCSLLLIDF